MIADLVFIGVYGIGSVLGGLYFRAHGTGITRHIGNIVPLCGAVSLLTDYGEMIAQFIQLTGNEGSDALAGFAATMQPVKMLTWVATCIGILAAPIIERIQNR